MSDVTRELVTLLDALRVGGSKGIAQMVQRAGKKISREAVRRLRKARTVSPEPGEKQTPPVGRAVTAKTPNHVWIVRSHDDPEPLPDLDVQACSSARRLLTLSARMAAVLQRAVE